VESLPDSFLHLIAILSLFFFGSRLQMNLSGCLACAAFFSQGLFLIFQSTHTCVLIMTLPLVLCGVSSRGASNRLRIPVFFSLHLSGLGS